MSPYVSAYLFFSEKNLGPQFTTDTFLDVIRHIAERKLVFPTDYRLYHLGNGGPHIPGLEIHRLLREYQYLYPISGPQYATLLELAGALPSGPPPLMARVPPVKTSVEDASAS